MIDCNCKTEGCKCWNDLDAGYKYCVDCVDDMAGQLACYRSLMKELSENPPLCSDDIATIIERRLRSDE